MNTKIMTGYTLLTITAGSLMMGCAHAQSQQTVTPTAAAAVEQQTVSYDKPGFFTKLDTDGRLWVFIEGSDAHQAFVEKGKPARHVVRPGAGPGGITLKSDELETVTAYVVAKPGFFTKLDTDGRLWVFTEGSDAHQAFVEKGKPARHVVRPGAGPGGITLKSDEFETIDAYSAAR